MLNSPFDALSGIPGPFARRRGRGFNPASLFANGEQGAFYDPSDLSTLFQDDAGTTPVTEPGQTVGLVLDKRRGLEFSPSVLSSPSLWSINSWVLDGDVLTKTAGNTDQVIADNFLTFEALYRMDFELIEITGGSVELRIGSGTQTRKTVSETGLYSLFGRQSGGGAHIRVVPTSDFSGSLRIISVRELPGNHATQPTAESRPVYQAGGGLHWLELDGVDDFFHVPVIKETSGPVSFFTGFQRFISQRLQYIMDIEDGRFIVAAGSEQADSSGFFGPGNWRQTETDNNTPYILSALYGSANASFRLNGVQYRESTSSERALAGTIKIGEGISGEYQLNGKIFSLVFIARIAEFDEVSATEQFIAQRSGVTL